MFRFTSIVCIVLASLVVRAAAAGIGTLDIGDYPSEPDVTGYDPDSPPNDLPKDDEGTQLDGDATFGIGAGIGGFNVAPVPGQPGKFKLSEYEINVTAQATEIRVPNDETGDDSTLLQHEKGHHDLYKAHYDANAKRKLEDAMRGIEDMVFEGTGSTPAERHQSALDAAEKELKKRRDRFTEAMKKQVDTLNAKYDKVTDHGRNDKSAADGVAETKKEEGLAPPAGQQQQQPNQQQAGARSENQSGISYDPVEDHFIIAGNNLITSTNDPTDPLTGQARFQIDPLQPIGLQEDGTYHLAYAPFALTHLDGGEKLLDGFLFELAYMPSHRPGYEGMFQGFLDIPPLEVLGTNNFIGSPTLDGLQSAVDENRLTMFWYHTPGFIFDPAGNILLGPSPMPGLLEFGVAQQPLHQIIPEPTPTILWFICMFALLYRAGRDRDWRANARHLP